MLVRAPEQAAPLLRQRLQPVQAPRVEHLQRLLAQLDSRVFKERERASQELTTLGELALPALRDLLIQQVASLEQQQRVEQLLKRLEDPAALPTDLREIRALEVLERIGSRTARRVVESFATGTTAARATREAQVILRRWP